MLVTSRVRLGARYRYVMDIDALGGTFGSSHGGDLDLITGQSDVDPLLGHFFFSLFLQLTKDMASQPHWFLDYLHFLVDFRGVPFL